MSLRESFQENKRMRDAQLVKEYLKVHTCDLYSLFATAYFIQNKLLDKYEVQTNVDRYKLAEEVPSYVIAYLSMKQN